MWKLTFSRVTAALSRILPLPIAVAIFVLDMITPREAAFAVLYVGVVLMAARRSAAARGIALTAAGCACLTLLAYISDRETLANATLSVVAIAARLSAIRGRWAEGRGAPTEAEWQEIFEHNPVMYFVLDSAGTVLSVDSFGAAKLYVADELVGQSVFQVFLDTDRERVRANLNLCLESLGQSNTWEVQKVRQGWRGTCGGGNGDGDKRANGGVVVLMPAKISPNAGAEKSVRESAKRFRALIEHAYDAVLLLDSHNSVLYVSPSVERIRVTRLKRCSAATASTFSIPMSFQTPKRNLKQLAANPAASTGPTADSSPNPAIGSGSRTLSTNLLCEPSVHAFVVNLRDITESKQAGTRCARARSAFRTFVDHATDGFFLFDEHQAIRDVNRQACESLGYSREEMIGMHPRDFDAGLDAAAIARIGERVRAEKP